MPLKVFYCYAHEDKTRRSFLEKHLSTLKRQALITEWHDGDINAGKEREKEIDTNMSTADIILLLISPDFIHSDYCYGIGMEHALDRHKNGTARVVPIILRPGDYKNAPFSTLQPLPTDAIPVTDRKWHNRDEAFSNVAQGIRAVVEELVSNQWLSEGNIHFFRQQYQEALEAFDRAIYFNSNNTLAYIGQGQTLNQLAPYSSFKHVAAYEDAVNAFSQAINLDFTNVDAYTGKGQALLAKSTVLPIFDHSDFSSKEEILEAFNQALRLDPENEAAYLGQGDTFILFENYEEALEAYRKSIKYSAFPNRDTYKKLGKALQKLNRYKEALEAYDICIKQDMKEIDLYEEIAEILQQLERYEEALQYYNKVLSSNSKGFISSGKIYIQKGKILYSIADTENALEAFENALNLLPEHAKTERAEAHRGKGTVLQFLASWEFQIADELEPPEDLPPLEDLLGDLQDEPVEKLQDELPDWDSSLDEHPF